MRWGPSSVPGRFAARRGIPHTRGQGSDASSTLHPVHSLSLARLSGGKPTGIVGSPGSTKAAKNSYKEMSDFLIHDFQALSADFYNRSADRVAPDLLGMWVLRNTQEGWVGGPIVEVEAYLAEDPASHSFRGPSKRNQSMFGPPGRAYVYRIYGMHYCLNAVCRPQGCGEAVLIRAIEPRLGKEAMKRLRPVPRDSELTNGPAKLCQSMEVDLRCDGGDLCDAASGLWIGSHPSRKRHLEDHGPVSASPRIGITKAADWPLRFFMRGSKNVSRASSFKRK